MNAIVWCVDEDEKYNAMVLHSIFSARENDKTSDFFVLTLKTNPYAKLFSQFNRLDVLYVDDYYSTFFKKCHASVNDVAGSSFAYCRFLVFKLDIFKKYEKVLYLDCDTSIKQPFDDIFNIPAQDGIKIMLVPECLPSNYNLKLLKAFCKKNNLEYDEDQYGNSGVMVVVPDRINEKDFANLTRLMSFNFPIHDQGIWNFYFQHSIQFINARFNAFHESDPNDEVANDVVIRQYAGNEKNTIMVGGCCNETLSNILKKMQKNTESLIDNAL